MAHLEGLAKKEREAIYRLFIENDKLKFNEIEKALGIRSNMVSYHLEKMQEEHIIEKDGDYYRLTKGAERYLPVFSQLVGHGMSPLPVVLVALVDGDNILMVKRRIRPYKDYWSLIGGKMHLEETFADAAERQIVDKVKLDGEFMTMNSILHERVEGENIIKHSFILFFVKMKATKTEIPKSMQSRMKWVKISEAAKEKVIPSDLWLIENKLDSEIEVQEARMYEKDGELMEFRVLE